MNKCYDSFIYVKYCLMLEKIDLKIIFALDKNAILFLMECLQCHPYDPTLKLPITNKK